VVVLCGGPSAEREVSLRSGERVYQALSSLGYDVGKLDWLGAGPGRPDLGALLREAISGLPLSKFEILTPAQYEALVSSEHERRALLQRCARFNMAIYRSAPGGADPSLPRALGRQLGLEAVHRAADEADMLALLDDLRRSPHPEGGTFLDHTTVVGFSAESGSSRPTFSSRATRMRAVAGTRMPAICANCCGLLPTVRGLISGPGVKSSLPSAAGVSAGSSKVFEGRLPSNWR